ncbi:MAG: hypothetical protein HFG25_00505 [Lachnospiraceae bacterium]|nr:hypothetical protein [Lachnospiraceae bacterium]
MIDWEEICRTEKDSDLREAKLWLFQENIRLENARKELELSQRELELSRKDFENECTRRRKELDEQNRHNLREQKRLREENLFFEKKLAILKDGFRQLEADRKELEQKRHRLSREWTSSDSRLPGPAAEEAVKRLFHSAGNQLALRKRYRDLVKIFHPDNLFGDEELVQMINREYLRRKCDE